MIKNRIQEIQDLIPELLKELELHLVDGVTTILAPLQTMGFDSWNLELRETDGVILTLCEPDGGFLEWNVKCFNIEENRLSNVSMDDDAYDVLDTLSNYILNNFQSALDNNLFGEPDSGIFANGNIETVISNDFGM